MRRCRFWENHTRDSRPQVVPNHGLMEGLRIGEGLCSDAERPPLQNKRLCGTGVPPASCMTGSAITASGAVIGGMFMAGQ